MFQYYRKWRIIEKGHIRWTKCARVGKRRDSGEKKKNECTVLTSKLIPSFERVTIIGKTIGMLMLKKEEAVFTSDTWLIPKQDL